MSAALGKIIEELVDFFKRNYKRPKLWIGIFILIVLIVLLIPYIDSNFFYFTRIEKRIKVLERVMELDQDKIKSNPAYLEEYNNILDEMKQQRERSINLLMNAIANRTNNIALGQGNRTVKFLTGAMWAIIITVLVPFMDTFKKKSDKMLAFFLMIVITLIVGGIFATIPIIFNRWINYIGFPILQFVAGVIFITKNNKKNREKTNGK